MFAIFIGSVISSTQSIMYLSMFIFEDIHSIYHIKSGYVMKSDRFPHYVETIYEAYSHKSNKIYKNILHNHYVVYEVSSIDGNYISINEQRTIEALLKNSISRVANNKQQFYKSLMYLIMQLLVDVENEQRQGYRFAYESDKAISNNSTFPMSTGENMFIYDVNQEGVTKVNDIDFMTDVFDIAVNEFENIFSKMFSNYFNIKCISNADNIRNELKQMYSLSKTHDNE